MDLCCLYKDITPTNGLVKLFVGVWRNGICKTQKVILYDFFQGARLRLCALFMVI